MKVRRYYAKGSKHKYVLSDEQFDKMVEKEGIEMAIEKDNANFELIPDNKEEAFTIFNDCCERVIKDPRFYLENIDKVPTVNLRMTDIYEKIEENDSKTEKFIN